MQKISPKVRNSYRSELQKSVQMEGAFPELMLNASHYFKKLIYFCRFLSLTFIKFLVHTSLF